ncbi:monocarboxylate transporter 14-like isoform X3 [Mytilus californianus]|uniref:monocarboxylate transporter 14-like isoform X3 n=1 Tax=Mytilus californianus TaxID=6549 RepID=UPI002246C168|nr:monocarboxylate transporter 14-like isoform X3 [Mytilus californianus]
MTKPDRGWAWVVAASSFFAHCISGYFQWASGMVHIVLLETFDDSLLKTSWFSALFLALISLAGPLTGVLINRFNCRISMMVGSLILTIGLVTTALVPNINWTFLTLGLLSGFIVDFGGTYGDSFTAAGVLLLCGAFIGLLSSLCQNKDNHKKDMSLDFEIDIELTEKEQMLNKR